MCQPLLTLMQSICQVNCRLIGGCRRRRYCFILIVIFVSIFISTQIQFSTHGRDAARCRWLFRLPQFHLFAETFFFLFIFSLRSRACLYRDDFPLHPKKEKLFLVGGKSLVAHFHDWFIFIEIFFLLKKFRLAEVALWQSSVDIKIFSKHYIKENSLQKLFSRDYADDLQLTWSDHLQLKWESKKIFRRETYALHIFECYTNGGSSGSEWMLKIERGRAEKCDTPPHVYYPLTARSNREQLFSWLWKSC